MAKVAVITRTKDREAFLRRALQSVARQTFTDYQHVIVNDGGDKVIVDAAIQSLSAENKSKVVVFHRELSSNAPDTIFNESIDRVTSDYVAIHDDDDTWHPEFLQRTVELLDNGSKGVVVKTDKIIERVKGFDIQTLKTTEYMPDLRAVSLYRQCIDNQLTPIAFIYNRSAYEAAGKYDSSLPVVGDWEFGIRFLQKFDVEYLDPGFALANYHHREQSGDNSFASHNHRKYITQVFNKYLRQELSEGKLGVGYIMNDLRYEQDMITSNIRKLLPKTIVSLMRKKVR